MNEAKDRELLLASLRSWGRRRRDLGRARDPLVREALAAGITKSEIHYATKIGRMTIDRIVESQGALRPERHAAHDPAVICRPAGNGLCEPLR